MRPPEAKIAFITTASGRGRSVTNLDLSVDILYNHVNGVSLPGGGDDIGWLQGMVRAQRNFYP